ncbi:Amidase signature domain [Fusarium agapanthi]|uniref:Amidase signature domain n=1 Tax=Fusarium agapanthi TaxID=1803897 RepID=A0A9P5EDG3_9HYPO|nr:Amidase signature domain [Fusarium agapanthi]
MGSGSSRVTEVDGVPYLVHPQCLAKIVESYTGPEPCPVVLLQVGGDCISSVDDALQLVNRFSGVFRVLPGSLESHLPPGPYFLRHGGIHQAYRLYEDTLDSFIFGVIPLDPLYPEECVPLDLLCPKAIWKRIAIPSRLYHVRTSETPLAGAHMGIKDIFGLKGTQTTMMSRPWIELYDPDEQSADYT